MYRLDNTIFIWLIFDVYISYAVFTNSSESVGIPILWRKGMRPGNSGDILKQELSMEAVATVFLILQWREKIRRQYGSSRRPERFSSSDLSCVSYYSASFQLSKCFCASYFGNLLPKKKTRNWKKKRKEWSTRGKKKEKRRRSLLLLPSTASKSAPF
jgi:hypothetical protein